MRMGATEFQVIDRSQGRQVGGLVGRLVVVWLIGWSVGWLAGGFAWLRFGLVGFGCLVE